MPLIVYLGIRGGSIGLAGMYDLAIRALLAATLLYSIRHHKPLLMQAATVGLLVVQMIFAPTLYLDQLYIQYLWAVHLDELIIFVLLMCAELIMLIDSPEFGE